MIRCKDCKWWEPYWNGVKLRGYGFCCHEKVEFEAKFEQLKPKKDGVITYISLLKTGPKFGCIHGEAK